MLSFFAKIFGAPKAVEKGIDTVNNAMDHAANGIDALFFTDEEKSQAQFKVMDRRMEMVKAIQDENTARSITRRILAIIIVASTFLHFNLWALLIMLGTFWPKYIAVTPGSPKVNAYEWGMSQMLGLLKVEVQICLLVCFFYFGYYGVKGIMNARKNNGS